LTRFTACLIPSNTNAQRNREFSTFSTRFEQLCRFPVTALAPAGDGGHSGGKHPSTSMLAAHV
jgi:hypothetical protein